MRIEESPKVTDLAQGKGCGTGPLTEIGKVGRRVGLWGKTMSSALYVLIRGASGASYEHLGVSLCSFQERPSGARCVNGSIMSIEMVIKFTQRM